MSVFAGWVLIPVVLGLLVVGHGLLVGALCRLELSRLVIPGVGLASVVVVSTLLTLRGSTATFAAPACAGLAAAGFAIRVTRRPVRRVRGLVGALALAVIAFLLLSASSLLSGQASVEGYTSLDDSAIWLGLMSHVMESGRSLKGVPVSSYSETLRVWLGSGYPVGSFLPLGMSAKLARTDPLAGYQAVVSVYGAVLALGLATIARQTVVSRPRAAFAGLLSLTASMFLAYVAWGGIKEVATIALLPTTAVLIRTAWQRGPRAVAPLALVCAALVDMLGVNGLAWSAPAMLAGVIGAFVAQRRAIAAFTGAAVVLVVGCLPAITTLSFVRQTTEGGTGSSTELGHLVAPLPLLQGSGLWPEVDFRFPPSHAFLVHGLAALCLASLAAALVVAVVRRHPDLVILTGLTFIGCGLAIRFGSPWIDAKALAIASPVVLLGAAALAFGHLRDAEALGRSAAAALAAVLVAGAAWSGLAAAAGTTVAPRARLAELRHVADIVGSAGPLLLLDPEIYGDRYLLRAAAPEAATDLRYRAVRMTSGDLFPELSTAEVDSVATSELFVYPLLVRRRSPSASRPPAAYSMLWSGEYWEVWRRPPTAVPPLKHVALGSGADPAAPVPCALLTSLAATPGAALISVVPRTRPAIAAFDLSAVPASWRTVTGVVPDSDGTTRVTVTAPVDGRYRVWVGGGTRGRLDVRVDGRPVGGVNHDIALGEPWLRFGIVALTAGPHIVEVRYRSGLRIGTQARAIPLGPVALSPVAADGDLPVQTVPATQVRQLCTANTSYDWVEVSSATDRLVR
jgi:hypothetical protein